MKAGRPKSKNLKSRLVQVRLDNTMFEKLKGKAEAESRSISNMVRLFIENALNQDS